MRTDKQPLPGVSTQLLLRGALWIGIGTILASFMAIWWFDQRAYEIRIAGLENTARLMAEGVAIAVEEDVISQNYAELETRLKQTLADIQVLSVLVADRDGRVLSHIQRTSPKHEAKPIYAHPQIPLPSDAVDVSIDDDVVTQWLRLDAGVPIGWLQLRISTTEADHTLIKLRQEVMTWLLIACLVLLTALTLVLLRTRGLVRLEEGALLARNDALEQVAYRDSLTGLPNRHLLLDRLEQAIAFSERHDKKFAVCFMDLDGFKTINDSHGHEIGDLVLRVVGQRVQKCLRKNDTVARLGGDEFVILLTEISDEPSYVEVLERILSYVHQPIQIARHVTTQISTSIGVSIYPTDNSPPSVLIEHADQAMYQAKRSGKNRWLLYEA
jgi:diguanylate cyclase (GGDEF)-like protein